MANYFKGKTLQNILNVDVQDFMDWGRPKLRQAVSRLASAANKRTGRLTKSGIPSPALREVEGRGKFSTSGKSVDELRGEFIRAKQFLESPTSTVTGAREFRDQIRQRLEKQYDTSISNDAYSKLLNTYLDIRDSNPDVIARTIKYRLMRDIEIATEDNTPVEELADRITDDFQALFNEGGPQYDGVSEFFDLG